MKGKQLVSVVLAAKKTSLKLLTTTLLVSAIPTGQALAQAVDYSQLVNTPSRSELNPGLTSPDASYMKSVLGKPGALTEDCSLITNPNLEKLIVKQNVGPFTVTGYKPAVEALGRIFAQVKRDKPELYSQLEVSGMLCVRKVRGGSDFSNHSWGTAIDIKIKGQLDEVGDGKTQLGLKELYPYFNNEGFYWGAAYSEDSEDSMHFEASEQLIARWTSGEKTKTQQFNFETPKEGWWFTGGAGLDYDRRLEHSGRGNGWVRNTSGWNAINNNLVVEPNSECKVTAWLRTSDTLTDGYIAVRPYNRDGSVGSVINEIKLVGAGSPNPQNRDYNLYTVKFNSGDNNKMLFYVGLHGNGKDSWVQVDDAAVSCVSPEPQPPTPPKPQPPTPPVEPTDINQAGLDLVKEFEGFREKAYRDPGGVLTIGYGHTGPDVSESMIITPEEAERLLRQDVQEAEDAVVNLVTVPLNENQFSSLVSFVYNLGAGNLKNSRLLVLLNQGDYQAAAQEFLRFNTDDGVVLEGLTRRRKRERELFLTPVSPVPPIKNS